MPGVHTHTHTHTPFNMSLRARVYIGTLNKIKMWLRFIIEVTWSLTKKKKKKHTPPVKYFNRVYKRKHMDISNISLYSNLSYDSLKTMERFSVVVLRYVCRVFSLFLSICLSIHSSISFFLFLPRAVVRRLELGKFAARRKFRGRGWKFSTSLHGDDHRGSQANRGLGPAVVAVKLKNVPVFSSPGHEKSARGSTTSLLRRARGLWHEQRQLWPWFYGDYWRRDRVPRK